MGEWLSYFFLKGRGLDEVKHFLQKGYKTKL